MSNNIILSANSFTNLFPQIYYDTSEVSTPILDMWNNYRLYAFPRDDESKAYYHYIVQPKDTIYSISNDFYKTTELWWLVMIVNNASDPMTFLDDVRNGLWEKSPSGNKTIKVIKDSYVPKIKQSISFYKAINDEKNSNLNKSDNI
jgi:hypothetical protein